MQLSFFKPYFQCTLMHTLLPTIDFQKYSLELNLIFIFSKWFAADISSIVLVPWFSYLGGYLSVPDDYPLVLGCEEHVSSLGIFVA